MAAKCEDNWCLHEGTCPRNPSDTSECNLEHVLEEFDHFISVLTAQYEARVDNLKKELAVGIMAEYC